MALLMGRLEAKLEHVEAGLADAVRRYHVRAQLGQLAAGVIGSLVLSLTPGGPGPLDWKTLAPLVVSAVSIQVRAQFPRVPLDLVLSRLGWKSPAAGDPAGAPPGGGGGR